MNLRGYGNDTTAPVLQSARVSKDGKKLTLYYDEELDPNSAPANGRFSANIAGTGHTLPRDGGEDARNAPVTVSGSTVTLNLALDSTNAVTAGQAVAMGYNPAAATANPLRNLAGLKAATVSGLAVANDRGETVPTLTAVAISSTPTHDTNADNTADTYGVGATIQFELGYSEAVTVDTSRGRPRLKFLMQTGDEKWAVYESGSGTQNPTFSYTVLSGDTSNGTMSVPANSLELTGGSIRSAASGRDASLANPSLGPLSNYKVNGALDAQPPRFESALTPGGVLSVDFNESLDNTSAPAGSDFHVAATSPDGPVRRISVSSVGFSSISTRVQLGLAGGGVKYGDVVTVSYTKPSLNFLKDVNGNAAESFSGQPVTNNSLDTNLFESFSVTAEAGTQSGSLTVNWTTGTLGFTPTGYDLRYYVGSEDPPAGREADWIEDAAGLPTDTAGTATSAMIEGLKANTAYRVQVRAKTAADKGPWSASAGGTTGTPPETNNAPRVLRTKTPRPASGNVCEVVNVNNPIKREIPVDAPGGARVSLTEIGGVSGRTDGWPSECNTGAQGDRTDSTFDDVDGDELTLTSEPYPVPANVRVSPGY